MKIAQQETAIAHYHGGVKEFSPSQHGKILSYVKRVHDACLSEIAYQLKMPPGTVSARCAELRVMDKLEWTGVERKSWATGVTCRTLRLPVRQMELC